MDKDAMINELSNALRALYDVQNDAPLERYRGEWNVAMVNANVALRRCAVFKAQENQQKQREGEDGLDND